ncbi:MAG: proline dehydrogenase family protein, partial [Phycisphaerae bacterium]
MSLLDVFRRRGSPSTNGHVSSADEQAISFLDEALEARIDDLGRDLLDRARHHRQGLLSKGFWGDKLMDWSMKDAGFKTQLFRFVDAFPTLTTPEQVHEHLVDYLSQPGVTPPPGMDLGLKAGGMAKGMMARTITGQITGMAQKFIAGSDAAGALPTLRKRWDSGLAFSVDLLGEACISDAEAAAYQQQYLDLVNNLPAAVAAWPANLRLETDHLGPIPRTNVSVKVSSLSARTDPIDFDGCIARCMETLVPILQAAAAKGVHINFDMESHATKDLTIALFMKCAEQVDFTGGLALQAYLRSGDDDAARVADWARRTGRQVTVRLVKGAYWDYETIHAEMAGWPSPVWSRKRDSDACFERMAKVLIDACPRQPGQGGTKPALGSHNARSLAASLAYARRTDLPDAAVEVQMLYGMADGFKAAAGERGLRVREYVPVGQMLPGMAYLVRRLLENTSNESWLRAGSADTADAAALLTSPHARHPAPAPDPRAPARHRLSRPMEDLSDEAYFSNEPPRDFAVESQRTAFAQAVARARVPHVEQPADEAAAREAVRVAAEAFPAWRDTDPRERVRCLLRAADLMATRRDELAGVIIKENGKGWRDADGDVCEAIDFCRYYARQAVGLFEPERLGRFVGELNEAFYQPRGVAAVI